MNIPAEAVPASNQESIWMVYESRKAQLRESGLTPEEYARAVRDLADELGV